MLCLLPKGNNEFTQPAYWDTFFKRRGKRTFEWYGEYVELCGVLHKYIRTKDSILVVGCGNSTLSLDLYDVGCKNITNIDVSKVAIKHMMQNCKTRPGLVYSQMDALNMDFKDESFSVTLDKGTMDALFPDDSEESKKRMTTYFEGVCRVLKYGGRYVCISLLQDYILSFLLDYFIEKGWLVRVCRCVDVVKQYGERSMMPVFAVVCTKFKKMANVHSVIEVCLDDRTIQKVHKEDLIDMVSAIQKSEIICSGLSQHNLASSGDFEASIDVCRPQDQTPRYSIVITDRLTKKEPRDMSFAAFIVPHGRERDWIFSSLEGRSKLRDQCNVDRLAVIGMHAGHTYPEFKEIQEELAETVLRFAPATILLQQQKVPFLSVKETVGIRTQRKAMKSHYSGHFLVEDVDTGEGEVFRRLIFMNRPNVVQSEVKLLLEKDEKGEDVSIVDYNHITSDYHVYMNIGVSLCSVLTPKESYDVLLLGLGGGILSMYIHVLFPQMKITGVEIDDAIHQVALDWFGLKEDDRLQVVIEEGREFLMDMEKKGVKYDVIILDIDSKEANLGLTCPPQSFLEDDVLSDISSCLQTRGVFLLNLVCRSTELRKDILRVLGHHFSSIVSLRTAEDVNEVVIALPKKAPAFSKDDLLDAQIAFQSKASETGFQINFENYSVTKCDASILVT